MLTMIQSGDFLITYIVCFINFVAQPKNEIENMIQIEILKKNNYLEIFISLLCFYRM